MGLNGHTVSVIIPAYNEAKEIRDTIFGLKSVEYIDKILVVDDGSHDDTSAIARSAGADVISLNNNRGKGYAMKAGYEICTTDIIAFLDADLGKSAVEAKKLLEPVAYGKADAAIAKFPMTKGKGGFGIVKALSRQGVKFLTGKTIDSVLSGQRAFKRSVLKAEMFKYERFGIEFGMTVDLIKNKARILEVEVNMKHRTTGRDLRGFIHRARQFSDILTVLLRKQLAK